METSPAVPVVAPAAVTPEWPCSKPLPKVLYDADLMAVLNIGHSSYFVRKKKGHFTFLEVQPQLPDSHTAYSGALVDRWLNGELRDDEKSRRFFGSARRGR